MWRTRITWRVCMYFNVPGLTPVLSNHNQEGVGGVEEPVCPTSIKGEFYQGLVKTLHTLYLHTL